MECRLQYGDYLLSFHIYQDYVELSNLFGQLTSNLTHSLIHLIFPNRFRHLHPLLRLFSFLRFLSFLPFLQVPIPLIIICNQLHKGIKDLFH